MGEEEGENEMIDLGEGEFVISGWALHNSHYCITNLGRTFKMVWESKPHRFDAGSWQWEQIVGTKYYKERT